YSFASGLNGVTDIIFITADTDLIIELQDLIVSTLETQLDVYTETTLTDNGTTIVTTNRNGNSSNTATLTAFHTPTINVLGNLRYTTRWGTGNKSGAIRDGFPAVLIKDTVFHLRITSRAAGNNITHELYFTEDTE
ncbi:unnamed protein product, partial [marine sediment metagenome]